MSLSFCKLSLFFPKINSILKNLNNFLGNSFTGNKLNKIRIYQTRFMFFFLNSSLYAA